MFAFFTAIFVGIVLVAVVVLFSKRRTPGTPLTWGEAFGAATFVFFMFVLAYGLIPHLWLTWCDKELAWRSDKIGIPAGYLGKLTSKGSSDKGGRVLFGTIPMRKNTLWPDGITFFGRGRVRVSAETIRDLVAATIYILMLSVQFYLWAFWQKRGKAAKAREGREAIGRSAYGRPLKKAEA